MKFLTLIPVLFLAACASHPRPNVAVRPLAPPTVKPVEAVRYADVIRPYHVGRYVDPNYPLVMHEQHPVYRVETSARWNLHPGPFSGPPSGFLNASSNEAFSPPLTNDVVMAEMNRQREATAKVMSEASKLARSYDELQKIIQEMKTVAKNQVTLNVRLAEAEQRMNAVQKQLEHLLTSTPPLTNNFSAFASEQGDIPRP